MRKEKIKIYLDTSVYNRPFDDQRQDRIKLETEAFLLILEKVLSGGILLFGSSTLIYENSKNPFTERKERVSSYISIASKIIKLNEAIRQKALIFEEAGIDPIDSLHLGHTEYSPADYFITCDDILIKKMNKKKDLTKFEICNPIEFVVKEVFKNA